MLYITAEGGDRVKRYNGTTGAFIDDFVTAGLGGLDSPAGLAYGPDGYWYVSSVTNDNVLRYDADGDFVDVFVDRFDAGSVNGPVFLTVIPEPATIVVLLAAAPLLRRRPAPRG